MSDDDADKQLAGALNGGRKGKRDLTIRSGQGAILEADAPATSGRASAWRRISDEDDTTPQPIRPPLTLGNTDLALEDLSRGIPELEHREWSGYRNVAVATAVVGVALAIFGLGERAGWGDVAFLPWGVSLVMLGGSAAALLSVLPGRAVRQPLESQAMEWADALAAYRKDAAWTRRTAISAWVFPALTMLALFLVPDITFLYTAFTVIAVVAALAWLVLTARRAPRQHVLLQTLLLRELEDRGLTPAGVLDPRVRSVMSSLDRLLGDLPDSAVQRFLASEDSNLFLELLAEIRGD